VNLILIGLRGSGKSTLGRLVAAHLHRPFIDLDDLTPHILKAPSIAEAWAARGEAAFRKAEAKALRQILPVPAQVIALGGGTPTHPTSADLLRTARRTSRSAIVYLRASISTLQSRLRQADNAHRPSLTGIDIIAEVPRLFAQRDPIYRALADCILHVDAAPPEQLVADIASIIDLDPPPSPPHKTPQ
jgi:shikimate kinase